MLIPSQLKVGGHAFTVIRAPLSDKLGETDWHDRTITLDTAIGGSTLGATFIHEILHVCNSTLGSCELGHALLDSLSEQLYAVLADNGLFAEDPPP